MEQNCWTKRSCSSGEFLSQKKPGRTAANLLTRNVAKRPLRGCQACISPTIIPDERRIAFHFVPQKTELVARATDEQAALAEVIARHRDAAASAEAADCAAYNVRGVIVPRKHRHVRAVYGPIDRRFPKRHPEIEAMYPGHFLPVSPQMLEELLRRSLELELSLNARRLIALGDAA
jgi:hypothetical protein